MFQAYGWQPTIGDPSFMGWVTVGAYFLTSLIALRLVLNSKRWFSADIYPAQMHFWLVVFLLVLALGVNKQLDLQSLITAMGRYYAARDGWLEYKRYVQIGVIISILIIAAVSLLFFFIRMRQLLKINWLAITGLTCLLVFIVSRATSFHHMDIFIGISILGARVNWIMELGELAAIALSALSVGNKAKGIARNQGMHC
jgi:hypothetical protein